MLVKINHEFITLSDTFFFYTILVIRKVTKKVQMKEYLNILIDN